MIFLIGILEDMSCGLKIKSAEFVDKYWICLPGMEIILENIGGISMSNQIDSKKKSASEAFVNSFGGYPIGYGVGIVILPLSMGWIQEDPLVANLVITLVYAIVSFVRSYVLRRTFEKYGIDDNFIKLGMKLCKKVRVYFENKRSLFYRKSEAMKK